MMRYRVGGTTMRRVKLTCVSCRTLQRSVSRTTMQRDHRPRTDAIHDAKDPTQGVTELN